MAAAQCITAQLLIMRQPIVLSNAGGCIFVHGASFFASSEKFVGNWQASALRLSEEAVEFATSGVERALLLFRAVVDQRAAVLVDHVAEKSVSRHFP